MKRKFIASHSIVDLSISISRPHHTSTKKSVFAAATHSQISVVQIQKHICDTIEKVVLTMEEESFWKCVLERVNTPFEKLHLKALWEDKLLSPLSEQERKDFMQGVAEKRIQLPPTFQLEGTEQHCIHASTFGNLPPAHRGMKPDRIMTAEECHCILEHFRPSLEERPKGCDKSGLTLMFETLTHFQITREKRPVFFIQNLEALHAHLTSLGISLFCLHEGLSEKRCLKFCHCIEALHLFEIMLDWSDPGSSLRVRFFRDLRGDGHRTMMKFLASRAPAGCSCLADVAPKVENTHEKKGACHSCGTEKNHRSLFPCSKCKLIHYCCRECQTNDYRSHKSFCREICEAKASENSQKTPLTNSKKAKKTSGKKQPDEKPSK